MSNFNRPSRRRQFDGGPTLSGNTYAGDAALPFLAPALKANDTVGKGYVTLLENVRYKAVMNSTSIANDLIVAASGADANCGFQDGDSVTVTDRVLTVTDMKVNEELCRATIQPHWQGATGSRHSDWANDSFRNFVMAQVAAKAAEKVEDLIWKGGSGLNTGFLSNDGTYDTTGYGNSILGSGGGATELDWGSGTLSATNVIDNMGATYQKAATDRSAILSKSDCAMYVSSKTFALYQQALATAGGAIAAVPSTATSGTTTTGTGYNAQVTNQNLSELSFLGLPVLRCPGMPDNIVLITPKSNLFVGTNLRTDLTEARYVPVYEFDGSDNIRVVMRFGLGVQCGVQADVVVGAYFI